MMEALANIINLPLLCFIKPPMLHISYHVQKVWKTPLKIVGLYSSCFLSKPFGFNIQYSG
jgi:hypothetical protein